MAGKIPLVPVYEIKHATDYLVMSKVDVRDLFSNKPCRIYGEYGSEVVFFGDGLLRELGHGDIGSISIRDLRNFRVEIVMYLARHMAIYSVVPQRYGHHPSNIVACALNAFSGRIQRVRSGHKLPFRSSRATPKRNFGRLVTKLCDNSLLWLLSERYVQSYKWRLAHGYCDEL